MADIAATLYPVTCSVCNSEIGSSSKEISEPIVCSECQETDDEEVVESVQEEEEEEN